MGYTRVDIAAVRAAAQRFDTAAGIHDGALRTYLTGLRFDGATAGRAHTARGDALRTALGRLTADMAQWSRSAEEISGALRLSADRYAEAELRTAAGVG